MVRATNFVVRENGQVDDRFVMTSLFFSKVQQQKKSRLCLIYLQPFESRKEHVVVFQINQRTRVL